MYIAYVFDISRAFVDIKLTHFSYENVIMKDGTTALHLAAQNNHCAVVTLLLDWKADIDITDNVSDK